MYCPNCGTEYADGVTVCVHCGTKLTVAKLFRSFMVGGGAGVLCLLAGIIKDKLGMYYRWAPVKTWLEVIRNLRWLLVISFVLSCIVFIFTLFFDKQEEVICPQCEEAFSKTDLPTDLPILSCPKCGTDVVNIKWYYKAKKKKA